MAAFPEPIRILSDLHLGHVCSALKDVREIAPLLDGAGTVIFNGDTFEPRAKLFRERSREQEKRLHQLLDELQVKERIFLTGNHDPAINERHYLELNEGKVLVTHGDFIFRYISPWSKKLRPSRPAVDRILAEVDDERLATDLDYRLRVTRECCKVMKVIEVAVPDRLWERWLLLAKEFWPPTRVPTILGVWLTSPHRITKALERYRPAAETIIFGHTHYPGIWKRNGRLAINTGGYLSVIRASVVEMIGNEMRVYKVVAEHTGLKLNQYWSR